MKLKRKSILAVVFTLSMAMNLGAAWTTKRLTNNTGASESPSVAVWGSNIYAVWSDDTPGNHEIYFRKSTDGGVTWQTARKLTDNTGSAEKPKIAVRGPSVYVVWHDNRTGHYQIYFRKSMDGGTTWQPARKLADTTADCQHPAIAVDDLNVFVTWNDWSYLDAEITLRGSTDGGATWQPAKRLTNNTGNSLFPEVAVSGSNVFVAWYDYTPGDYADIYFRKSADGGATWLSGRKLTDNAGESQQPDMAVAGSMIYLVWADNTPGNYEIFVRKSTDDGATWQTQRKLVTDAGSSFDPTIAVSGTNVFVAWHDLTPGNPDIYFRESANGGATWETLKRLTDNTGDSTYPDIAANSSNVYIVYQDDTLGNSEIYLKYSPL